MSAKTIKVGPRPAGAICPADIPETEEEKKLKEKRSTFYLIAGAVLILAVLAAILFWPGDNTPKPDETYRYNFFTFSRIDDTWWTEVQVENSIVSVALRYGPREVEHIPVTGNIPEFAQNDFAYISLDPTVREGDSNLTFAVAEVAIKLGRHWVLESACSQPADFCTEQNITVANCQTTTRPVITFDRSQPRGEIIVAGNCATIKGQGEELIKAADRFMLGMYGIMP